MNGKWRYQRNFTADVTVIQVIVTTLELRGKGTHEDPCRRITQFWDMEGRLLGEYDINSDSLAEAK